MTQERVHLYVVGEMVDGPFLCEFRDEYWLAQEEFALKNQGKTNHSL